MLTIGRLIQLALGETEANKVDTAIPQAYFDNMGVARRADIAGWYYEEPNHRILGRLLTKVECWDRIVRRVADGDLEAYLGSELVYGLQDWKCFRFHVEQGHIQLMEKVPV